MDLLSFIVFALIATGVVALIRGRRPDRHTAAPPADRLRRGTGHALLGLQQFVEPSVEHIFEVENREHAQDDDEHGDGDDTEAIKGDLATALSRPRIDAEEVRRVLAAAVRAGLDWQAVYEQAVRNELADRPYRAPAIPPVWKLAPPT